MAQSVADVRQEVAEEQPADEQSAAEQVVAAQQEIVDARRATESELDELGTSARAALDIPAKVKRNPLRYGALGAGTAFLVVGGPKRVLRAVERRFFPRPRVRRLLPDEIDRTVDQLPEENREEVRAHLERDFAAYVQREHAKPEPSGRRSFWRTYDTVLAAFGALAIREMAKRLLEVPERRSGPEKASPPPDEEGYTA
jgi:hypothetical protein